MQLPIFDFTQKIHKITKKKKCRTEIIQSYQYAILPGLTSIAGSHPHLPEMLIAQQQEEKSEGVWPPRSPLSCQAVVSVYPMKQQSAERIHVTI